MKKIFIETYGCQMNEYDTHLVKAILTKANYTFVPNEDEADVVLLNTCAIRENAHRKVYGRVHDILHKRGLTEKTKLRDNPVYPPKSAGHELRREASGQNPKQVLIGILGCMATNLRRELFENRKLKIDFIAGPDSYKRLPQLIEESMKCEVGSTKPFDVTLSEFETYSDIFPKQAGNGHARSLQNNSCNVNAWIAVMRGCNNFCTFCVVPYTRGRERSRAPENVVEEVKKLAQEGFKQVTLLGQNVNSYYYPFSEKMDSGMPGAGADFADLLEAVSKVEGIKRIRFTSPHPKDFPEKLLYTIAENPKVCKHIHLPAQSGNNRVLDLMDRTYSREEFLKLVKKIRQIYPDMSLTTDIIAGFPTETAEEFEDTLNLMREVEFDSAFMFKYSERKGTIASNKYPDDIPEEKKSERLTRLIDLQKKISFKKNQARIGKIFDVLIEEERTPRSADQFQGRSDGNSLVIFPAGDYRAGETIPVKITDASANCLKGTSL